MASNISKGLVSGNITRSEFGENDSVVPYFENFVETVNCRVVNLVETKRTYSGSGVFILDHPTFGIMGSNKLGLASTAYTDVITERYPWVDYTETFDTTTYKGGSTTTSWGGGTAIFSVNNYLGSGLLNWFLLDNNLLDYKGNMTLSSEIPVSYGTSATSFSGSSLIFGGHVGSKLIGSPYVNYSNYNEQTISFWINPTSACIGSSFVGLIYNGSNQLSGSHQFYLEMRAGSLTYVLSGSPSGGFVANFKQKLGSEWQHVALTRENGSVTCWINAVKIGSDYVMGSGFVSAVDTNWRTYVGAIVASSGSSSPFTGSIDDLRFYNRKVSDTEIGSLYNSYYALGSVLQTTNVADTSTLTNSKFTTARVFPYGTFTQYLNGSVSSDGGLTWTPIPVLGTDVTITSTTGSEPVIRLVDPYGSVVLDKIEAYFCGSDVNIITEESGGRGTSIRV